MLTTTRSFSSTALLIKLSCPSCKNPMVGTNPTFSPSVLHFFTVLRTLSTVLVISIFSSCNWVQFLRIPPTKKILAQYPIFLKKNRHENHTGSSYKIFYCYLGKTTTRNILNFSEANTE